MSGQHAGDAVVMVTMADRVEMLNVFMQSLVEHGPAGVDILIHVQAANRRTVTPVEQLNEWSQRVRYPDGLRVGHLMMSDTPQGCHAARVQLLRDADRYDRYVNVDDDVELVRQTHWEPALDKCTEEGVGFVITNWVRHPSLLVDAVNRMEDVFYPQVMMYQGGGMCYDNDVADLMRGLPAVPARYDDLWPLTTYLNGYRNYRYQGSLAVHRIMQKGGMNDYMKAEPRPLLAGDWVNYPLLKNQRVGSEYGIPMDGQLKQCTVETHHAARAAKGWPAHRSRA